MGGEWSASASSALTNWRGTSSTFEVAYTGETTKETVTLLKLTDDEMESRDKEGKIDTYKRMKSK